MSFKKSLQLALFVLLAASLGAQEGSALTISGSVRPRAQLDLSDGTGLANLSSGPGGATFIRFTNRFSPYSSLVLRFGAPYLDSASGSAYDSNVAATNSWITAAGLQDAYGITDILGELGLNELIGLRLQAGMFRLKAPMFSRGLNFGLGTGDDYSRSEVFGHYTFPYPGASFESYKWSLEIPFNVLKDSFPLTLRFGSDLDLTGQLQKTGFTAYAEMSGRNLYLIDDLFVVDWALYSTLKARDAAPAGTPYIAGAQIYGGSLSVGFGFENGLSVGLGAAADYALYSYKAKWAGTLTLRDYNESDLNWQAGLDLTLKDVFKFYGAFVHRNVFDLDIGTVTDPKTPVNYSQDFAALRLDLRLVPRLTPYVGGTYVVNSKVVEDPLVFKKRGTPPTGEALSFEAGLMWELTPNITLDAGYTRGKNNAVATFGAVINALEQTEKDAVFFRAGWRF